MQTFITDFDLITSAFNLDMRRLGKQRVEAIQIARVLLGLSDGWKNHPAVKMWKGYEGFLVRNYLTTHLMAWNQFGYSNEKCYRHQEQLVQLLPVSSSEKMPNWVTKEFIESHRSNLIKKDYFYYKEKFPDTIENLPYIWPV